MSRKVIGVTPPQAKTERPRLFQALEDVFSLKFEPRAESELAGLDGALHFDRKSPRPIAGPLRSLTILEDVRAGRTETVQFTHDAGLDPRLRGRQLTERAGRPLAELNAQETDRVLATCGGLPIWSRDRSGTHDVALGQPGEIDVEESLRDHLCAGRFLSLLPLVHFLREVEGESAWLPPPLRASFVFDDPNLHLTRYGYVKYDEVSAHAQKYGYHVSFATVPLDFRFAHPEAVRIFQQNPDRLSLATHGNNHQKHELLRADTEEKATSLAAQALRRTAAFEERYKLGIDRVMVPPHARCGERMRRILFRSGYEAVTLDAFVRPLAVRSEREKLLAGWEPAQVLPGEVPIIVRHLFPFAGQGVPFDEAILSAFLDLPLVLYGHHWDLRDGLGRLDELATQVNSLGDVQWMSLREMSRTNFAQKREGSALRLKLYSRRVSLTAAETDRIVVEHPDLATPAERSEMHISRLEPDSPHSFSVRLVPLEPIVPDEVPAEPPLLWPVLRRTLTLTRDHLAPLRRPSARS